MCRKQSSAAHEKEKINCECAEKLVVPNQQVNMEDKKKVPKTKNVD